MIIVVSGFEPFGGEAVNPSALVARALDGWAPLPGFRVLSLVVPVTWSGALSKFLEGLRSISGPSSGSGGERSLAAIVMLGQGGACPGVTLERIAVNLSSGKDNSGVERLDEPVVPGGPAAYFTTLPVHALAKRVEAAGLPVLISNSAGLYLCNFLFYGVMHHLAASRCPDAPADTSARPFAFAPARAGPAAAKPPAALPLAGFVHLPYLPRQAAGKTPPPPSLSLADAKRAVRVIIRGTAEYAGRG